MASLTIKLPDKQKSEIKAVAERKNYNSVSEYVREALRDKVEEDLVLRPDVCVVGWLRPGFQGGSI